MYLKEASFLFLHQFSISLENKSSKRVSVESLFWNHRVPSCAPVGKDSLPPVSPHYPLFHVTHTGGQSCPHGLPSAPFKGAEGDYKETDNRRALDKTDQKGIGSPKNPGQCPPTGLSISHPREKCACSVSRSADDWYFRSMYSS